VVSVMTCTLCRSNVLVLLSFLSLVELVKRVNGKIQHSTCKAGDWFGDEAMKGSGAKYSSTCVALQTTSCWRMDAESMRKVVMPLMM
jgi:CRP-like cAMP-binding protein